jgi:hypothetical protein
MKCMNKENPETGLPCTEEASWVVGVGMRRMDRQFACNDCLGWTGEVMLAAEGRPGAELYLRKLGENNDSTVRGNQAGHG